MIPRKILHLALPIIIMLLLGKRFGRIKTGSATMILMLLKEIYDTVVFHDPLWLSLLDMLLSFAGVAAGILLLNTADGPKDKEVKSERVR